ncbi:MAG: hypothetical protein H5T47_06385, partial [Archaeoglobi archaeon]|nr:hypothetical protein [Candidatus Mnemosynella bozhongmuii]
MSKVSGDKIQFQNSETLDTPDTWDTRDTLDSEASNYFEPDCVRLARDSGTPEGLKLLLSYYRQRKYDEGGLIETARTYIVKHNLSISSNELLEILGETETFSCDYARSLGFCKRTCKLKLPPEKRLILELKSVIVWHSTSEISLRIGDLRKTLKLSQFWKKGKINPGIFDLLFIEAFLIPPTPPFTEETA